MVYFSICDDDDLDNLYSAIAWKLHLKGTNIMNKRW